MNMRPLYLVDGKLAEAQFFLDKMACTEVGPFEVRCYFSAFVSAARSVTFSLQAVMADLEGFSEWYAMKQEVLRRNSLARFFVDRRNETQKSGDTRINTGSIYRDESGNLVIRHYFSKSGPLDPFEPIEPDVIRASREYLHLLRELVSECFDRFACAVDWELHLTEEGLQSKDVTIEDIEEMLGYPRGWTQGIPDNERLRLLRASTSPKVGEWIPSQFILP